jgi:hypothetical protein
LKSLFIFLLVICTFSYCGTKEAIVIQQKSTKEVAVTTEVTVQVEPPVQPTPPEPPQPLKPEESQLKNTQKDSLTTALNSYQKLYKRSLTEHQLWDQILIKHVSDAGKVDYEGLKKDRKNLFGYIKLLQITYEKVNSVTNRSDKELLAFWINAYNALTIDLIIRNYPLKSIKHIKDPWDQRLWKFGEKWLNLNDIEHEILRKMNEPRIHFAIVCASESCPKLQNNAFTAENLDAQLTDATNEFLADTSKNEISQSEIRLSKIFKWFKKDFEQNGSLIDFLNQYSDITISNTANRSYKDYNWDLNE